jgi:antitoxin component of MazEF toxin-antitoxin module
MKVIKIGKSTGFIIPKRLCVAFEIYPGDEFNMDINKDEIRLYKTWEK